MPNREPDDMPLSKAEIVMLQRLADLHGVTVDEMATKLAQEELARRVKKRTGKTPAKVYSIKR